VFFFLHSWIRYVVLGLGLATLGYAIAGHARGSAYTRRMWTLANLFAAFIDAQVAVGALLLVNGRFRSQLGLHIVLAIAAAALAHWVPAVTVRKAPEDRRYLPQIVSTVLVLVIIVVSIVWIRRPVLGFLGI
jgi:hypothetical protein